ENSRDFRSLQIGKPAPDERQATASACRTCATAARNAPARLAGARCSYRPIFLGARGSNAKSVGGSIESARDVPTAQIEMRRVHLKEGSSNQNRPRYICRLGREKNDSGLCPFRE